MKVKLISECFVKPKSEWLPPESKHPYHLSPLDLPNLFSQYIQKGLLFHKPPHFFMPIFLHRLKNSFSTALLHFYPLSGRLVTITNHHHLHPSISIYVDCVNSPGAKFIHAALDVTISDFLSPIDVPSVVYSLFDHHKAVNYDGHSLSLLSLQVTELLDGIFIGCSLNHAIGDGTSYWNFFTMLSEIFQSPSPKHISISRPPVLKRWFPDGDGPIVNLPYNLPDKFMNRFKGPKFRERIFHFSAESIAKLKAKANAECGARGTISSLQSLTAFVWRSITRARRISEEQPTHCIMVANNRAKLEPPLSENYFGNVMKYLKVDAKAEELVGKDLGWAAWKLHDVVVNNTSKKFRETIEERLQSIDKIQVGRIFEPNTVLMGSSPRFNKYGIEFGMGKAVALRSGYSNKWDGKVTTYPGYEGGGSVDLEICLLPQTMVNLESDFEFMIAVSSSR
ncbi:hypothetical protein IC575_016056 [Cucumis melo]